MKFSDHIFYLFSLRRSVDELTTPPGGGGGGVGSKTLITVGQNLFFLENKVVLNYDFRQEPKNQVNRATRSEVMAISQFSSERAK